MWYLSRIKKARERQTWYFPIGTTVHKVIEHKIETGEELEFEPIFYALVREQRKLEPDTTQWLSGGPKDAPFMKQKAVDMGKQCVENAFKFLEKMDVWHVEYDASGFLPGCSVPIKAFVDIVGEHEDLGPLVVDWKSSASKPKNDVQLQTYCALLNQQVPPLDPEVKFNGFWAMLRPDAKPKTEKARFVDMSELDIEALGRRYQAAWDGMQAKKYPATSTFCDFCTQRPNCMAQSGPTKRATYYDKSDVDGIPF